ncbi:MAG: fasciclin domain-containing protein, partial [Candidatus Promineifilaceae bacterium]|nr:fasciclin domain-containing protein [Candidatus Promineifilaceae bacterium]
LYHVVEGNVTSAQVVGLDSATAISGGELDIAAEGNTVMVNNAAVVTADIQASNGIIHVIDSVLIPPSMMEAEGPGDIVTVASEAGQFETLLAAAEAAGLVETLQGEGPFTVFAPRDAAFEALPEGTLDALLADPAALEQVLLYHVVPGEVPAADVVDLESATTALGEEVEINVDGDTVMVNDATVVATDIEAGNGVIHVIDSVLIPPSMQEAEGPGDIVTVASEAGQFETLLAAAEAAGLVETLQSEGPFTVFAPRDAAFEALPEGALDELLADPAALEQVLLYHVVPGEVMAADVTELNGALSANDLPLDISADDAGVMVNNANVVATDIEASNGVIHVIDAVLLPPENDIVGVVTSDENFSTLATAVEAAGLVETLQGEGPFTVFAPTNTAFSALPAGALDSLLDDPDALSNVLLYHVAEGALFAGDVAAMDMDSLEAVAGETVEISVDDDGNVFINDAQVTMTNILTTNGIIHVIDAVLLPPGS